MKIERPGFDSDSDLPRLNQSNEKFDVEREVLTPPSEDGVAYAIYMQLGISK